MYLACVAVGRASIVTARRGAHLPRSATPAPPRGPIPAYPSRFTVYEGVAVPLAGAAAATAAGPALPAARRPPQQATIPKAAVWKMCGKEKELVAEGAPIYIVKT